MEPNKELSCTFCDSKQSQVKLLVAGPGVFICDGCVALCVELVLEKDPTFIFRTSFTQRMQNVGDGQQEQHLLLNIKTGKLFWANAKGKSNDPVRTS